MNIFRLYAKFRKMINQRSNDPIVQLNFTTTPIHIYKEDIKIGSATGFFFKHKEVRYLITNRHVVVNEEEDHFPEKLIIELHTHTNNLKDFDEFEIDLYDTSRKAIWREHPNFETNQCDVIAIELPKSIDQEYSFKSFQVNNFLNDRKFETIPDVITIGYPLGFYDDKNCLPVYRKGTIASAFGHYFDDLPYFLIDSNLHPGTSGSPVINAAHNSLSNQEGNFTTNSVILLGIHSAEHYFNEKPLGLNVVWYATLILEIIK